ncbi:PAS domain S-box protein [Pseudomonas sp. LRF_L74]|uniref:PAS domain S-box protein n=1 Tax=Pseudomonas sp. LRF_L74 TaxID=3369422 RepID=UPI003F60E399
MNYLTHLFIDPSDPGLLIYGSHNPGLVALSVFIAIFSSCLALQIAGMARTSQSPLFRQVAIITGALALGGGIWSMHFIGMLAFEICAQVTYDSRTTLLSMLPSLGASWVALGLLVRSNVSLPRLFISGVLVGAGIGAMHYAGMAAMRMAPLLRYDLLWFALSILLAVVLAVLALWVRFGLRDKLSPSNTIIVSGVVMGIAIAAMHYTGMAAARFVGTPDLPGNQDTANAVFLALSVALITVTFTILVACSNGLLRYRQLYRHLQGSESRMRAILETAVDGIITLDGEGLILSCNPAVERLFGWGRGELAGQNLQVLLPWTQSTVADAAGAVEELDGMSKQGDVIPVRLAIGRANMPGQALYVGFVSNISERKGMELALRESEQQYSSLIRNIPGVSFRCLLDEDWSMIFISEAVEGLTGWPAKVFTGREQSFKQIVHPDDSEQVITQVLEAVGAGRSYAVEYRMIRSDGTEIWVWESGSGVSDQSGQLRWIDGVVLDVTENKLRNSVFEGTVKAISRALAVIEFDLHGNILTANQNFLDLMGYQLEDLQGKHHRIFCDEGYVASREYEEFWRRLGSGEFKSDQFLRLGKDGRQVWIQATYNPIFNADGRPFKVVKFATDISQRREMERALRDAKNRAEQAAQSKTTFLANMSHEIRTPMNTIIGFTDLLLGSPLQAVQRRHLSTVRHAAGSLLGLLNDILDTAKLEKGALELECVDFSLREICEQSCASLHLGAEAKGLDLVLDYQVGLGDFYKGDPLRIQQVLNNLLGNAIKFTERGWVRLEVSADHGQVLLAVRDSGIGIAPDRLERIFEPFAQADASMSRRFGGTGLGTTIALQLVGLMDGELTVESRLGEGSLFKVRLPLQPGEAISFDAQEDDDQLPPLRILVADDVSQNIGLLALALGQLGHEVATVSDGEEAVLEFLADQFDVILMDVQMPRVDGLEATRRIRRYEHDEQRVHTPIVALTASVLEQDRRAAREAGMDGFASKPLELDKLLVEIARVTGRMPTAGTLPGDRTSQGSGYLSIDWSRGVRLWGSESLLVSAIDRFLLENHEFSGRVRAFMDAGDMTAAAELAHKVRGTAANLALVQLSSLAEQIEQMLKSMRPDTVRGVLQHVETELVALASQLLEVNAESVGEAMKVALDREELLALLVETRSALLRGELNESKVQVLLSNLSGGVRREVENALSDFDLGLAAELLSEALASLETSQ